MDKNNIIFAKKIAMKDRRHIVISGPSGCGKTTIAKKLLASNSLFYFSVSHTTRKPRIGEKEGEDYFFVSKETFEDKIKNGDFLEYAKYNGNYYGTLISQLEDSRKVLILDIERQGVQYLMQEGYDFRYIFLYCPMEFLLERLIQRTVYCKNTMPLSELFDVSKRLNESIEDFKVFNNGIYDLGIENIEIGLTMEKIGEFLKNNEKEAEDEDVR